MLPCLKGFLGLLDQVEEEIDLLRLVWSRPSWWASTRLRRSRSRSSHPRICGPYTLQCSPSPLPFPFSRSHRSASQCPPSDCLAEQGVGLKKIVLSGGKFNAKQKGLTWGGRHGSGLFPHSLMISTIFQWPSSVCLILNCVSDLPMGLTIAVFPSVAISRYQTLPFFT